MSLQRPSPPSRPTARPASRGLAVASTPLSEVELYRPGPSFALTILLIPVIVTLVAAAITLNGDQGIPLWLPFVLLLWIPCLPVIWLGMLSVRTDTTGIAAGRPWTRWREMPWDMIDRVEKRGPLLTVRGSVGGRLIFAPALLRDGSRLRRRLLLRLPAHVLSNALGEDAQEILTMSVYTMPEGGLAGLLRARSRVAYRLAVAALTLVLAAVGVVALLGAPGAIGLSLAVICWLGALAGACLIAWLLQEVRVNDAGIIVFHPLTRRTREVKWTQIELIEHSSREAVLRLRGEQRVVCLGPGILPRAQRDLLRAFLHEYGLNRDVPIVKRPRVLF
ncbi:MAG TPA: hypothetical protein VJN88_05605 [Ktedonobacterales bacterium]|nr:hypothetical protein [Ktedonobacterales bacterium]